MPSPADPARRHKDAEPAEDPQLTPAHETWQRPLAELARYAGWLGKDRVAVAVRADVHALSAAMDIGSDASPLLATLDSDIGRLPSSDLRKMLRKALGDVRAVLEPSGIDVPDGEGA